MMIEKSYWFDHKPSDNNKGYIYGIHYIDFEYSEYDGGEIVECEWFKTKGERNHRLKIARKEVEDDNKKRSKILVR